MKKGRNLTFFLRLSGIRAKPHPSVFLCNSRTGMETETSVILGSSRNRRRSATQKRCIFLTQKIKEDYFIVNNKKA